MINMLLTLGKRQPLYKVAGTLLNYLLLLGGKQNLYVMNFNIELRRFPNKVWEAELGFPLFLIVKYDRKEIHGGRNY